MSHGALVLTVILVLLLLLMPKFLVTVPKLLVLLPKLLPKPLPKPLPFLPLSSLLPVDARRRALALGVAAIFGRAFGHGSAAARAGTRVVLDEQNALAR